MSTDIRTPKGKLVGMLDERTSTLVIKDGKKQTRIKVPQSGLCIAHSTGDGAVETIYITQKPTIVA